MNQKTIEFLTELKEVFKKHNASVAFMGNRITWFVDDKQIIESGIASNSKTIEERIEELD